LAADEARGLLLGATALRQIWDATKLLNFMLKSKR